MLKITTIRLLPVLFTLAACVCPPAVLAQDQMPGSAASEAELLRQAEEESLNRLNALTLPEAPTREQAVAYARALSGLAGELSGVGNTNALLDAKLSALSAEHVDLVLTEYATDSPLREAAKGVLSRLELDDEALKQAVVENLADNPNNIGLIVRNGWCESVRPIIVQRVLAAEERIDDAWFYAAVELKDPELYPKLHELTVGTKNPFARLELLEALADYDLANTVDKLWQREQTTQRMKIGDQYRTPDKFSKYELATKAAANGSVDALGWLIDKLANAYDFTNAYPNTVNRSRLRVIRHIDFKGDNREIKAWFKANRDKLVFDQFTGRYVVADENL